jgi:ERF superfamily.
MTDKKTDDKPVGGNVYQRMHRAAALIEKRIPKANENVFQKFKYASHDDVVEFCRPALLEAGLVLTCDMPEIESSVETFGGKPTMVARGTLSVDVVNIDDPKDRYTVHVPGMAYDTSDKAIGKLISYAKKYALTACCGLWWRPARTLTETHSGRPEKVHARRGHARNANGAHRDFERHYMHQRRAWVDKGRPGRIQQNDS